MKSIIVLTLLTAIAMASTSGTRAFFNDNEVSIANQMSFSTLDLKTDDADGTSQTLYDTAIIPGNGVGPGTIILKNAGSTTGATLDISFSYVNNDGSPNSVEMTADETAAIFEVPTLSYDGTNLLTGVSDLNLNGYKDIQDVANADLSGQSGLIAGATKNFTIEVVTDNLTSPDFANDGITLTMNFKLNQ
jgi:hypothetical protein